MSGVDALERIIWSAEVPDAEAIVAEIATNT
jgi:hypothetical protein